MDNTIPSSLPVIPPPKLKINPLPIFVALTAVFFLTSLIFAFLYFSSSRGTTAPRNNTISTTPTEPTVEQVGAPGSPVTLTGKVTCIPKQNTNGQSTLECALGLQTDDGKYYGLSDPNMQYVTTLASGDTITITGLLTLSTNTTSDIVGTIEIQSLSK